MNEEVKAAMEIVVKYLDEKMEESPDRATADACNYLQAELERTDL